MVVRQNSRLLTAHSYEVNTKDNNAYDNTHTKLKIYKYNYWQHLVQI